MKRGYIVHIITIYLCRFIWLLVFLNCLFYQLLSSLTRLFFELFFYVFRVCCLDRFLFLFDNSIGNFFNVRAIDSIERVGLDNIDYFVSFLFLSYTALFLVHFENCLSCRDVDIHIIDNLFDILPFLDNSVDKFKSNLLCDSFIFCSFIFLLWLHLSFCHI